MTILKVLKYKSYVSFRACQKKIVKFTDLTNTIYWPTNIAKNQLTDKIFFLYMSALNTFQDIQCLWILTLPKCNDRPDLHNLQTGRKKIKRVASCCKGSFCQYKNQKYLQI